MFIEKITNMASHLMEVSQFDDFLNYFQLEQIEEMEIMLNSYLSGNKVSYDLLGFLSRKFRECGIPDSSLDTVLDTVWHAASEFDKDRVECFAELCFLFGHALGVKKMMTEMDGQENGLEVTDTQKRGEEQPKK